MPLVLETFGRTSDDVTKLITKLVRRASELSHFPYAVLLSYWKKRLSTALQVGNAEFLISAAGRNSYSAHLEDFLALENCV